MRGRGALFCLALGALSCRHPRTTASDAGPSASATPPPAPTPTAVLPPAPPAEAPRSFADLAAKADPAVAFVETLQQQQGRTGRRRVTGQGLGSGFVYDPSGLILTNNHVIKDATDITVTVQKKEYKATVIGRDAPTDIAVLRVEGKGLPHLPLGDSDAARVGDWVVAIGNPFGLSHTVSAGIVSAKERTRDDVKGLDKTGYFNFIQTDAAINQGNSGGPLLDMAGRVVGINAAIRANANNIGFAIPVNMVKELLPRLVKDGKVTRSWIGINVTSLVEEEASRLGIPNREGAIVRSVVPAGPGDRAGLQPNDVITKFEGEALNGPEKLRWLASMAGVGKSVSLGVKRDGRVFDMKVTLGELPDQAGPAEEPEDPFGLPPGHP